MLPRQYCGLVFWMLPETAHGFFTVGMEGPTAKIRSLAYSPAMIAEIWRLVDQHGGWRELLAHRKIRASLVATLRHPVLSKD
jgi:hypothetical protein